jgi:hypothetical protein
MRQLTVVGLVFAVLIDRPRGAAKRARSSGDKHRE